MQTKIKLNQIATITGCTTFSSIANETINGATNPAAVLCGTTDTLPSDPADTTYIIVLRAVA